MRWKLPFWLAIGGTALGLGCVTPQSVRQNEQIYEKMCNDMIRFYDNMSQAYYILGYDCFVLSEQARSSKNDAAADLYLSHARRYKGYSEELKQSAQEMRQREGLPLPVDRRKRSDTSPITPLEDSYTTRLVPVAVPEAPAPKASTAATTQPKVAPPGAAQPKATPPDTTQPKVAPPDTTAPPPETTQPPSTEQRPSLLGRLKFWGKKSDEKK